MKFRYQSKELGFVPDRSDGDVLDPVEILEIASDFTFAVVIDGDSLDLRLSEAIAKSFGLEPHAQVFHQLASYVHPGDMQAAFKWLEAVQGGGTHALEFRVQVKDQPMRWVRARARRGRDRQSGLPVVWGVAWDISEEKHDHLALAKSAERYRTLTEHAPVMFFEVNSEGRVLYTNGNCQAGLGYKAEELIGLYYWDLLPPDQVEDSMAALREYVASNEKGTRTRERPFRHKDGRYVRCEVNLESFRDADGQLRVIGIVLPIEERKRHEEERALYAERLELEVQERTKALVDANRKLRELQLSLVQAKRLEAEEHLAGSVAHAINNPLTALIGRAQMALDNPTPDEMRNILRLGRRIEGVVSQTLALYRLGNTSRKPERVDWLIEELVDQIRERALKQSVSIEVDILPSIPRIEVDRSLILSALGSLAENALDAMPNGGKFSVHAEGLLGLNVVRFEICDSGAGVDSANLDKIFDPFFSTRGGGTGLGLAIARGAVQGHDGRIFLEPRSSGGTRATIEIPITPM